MTGLRLLPADECQYDLVALGEVMLRLDPGDGRVRTARSFHVWEGGGEYNVARGLASCFGLRTAIVTALADNEVGRLIENLMRAGGVDLRHVRWQPFDGVGRRVRNGLNFTERGFGVRAALGTSDRGHSAASQMAAGDLDWDTLFGKQRVRWFHTGGIFAGLSESTPDVILEAIAAARRHGTIVSYDLNYRPSLWEAYGGRPACQRINREIAEQVDVILGNEEDFTACLGLEIDGVDDHLKALPLDGYRQMLERAVQEFPNWKLAATTLRTVHTASSNDWSAVAWHNGELFTSRPLPELEILDRVGGGDSFASGLIFGCLDDRGLQQAVELGAAHGALAMTTPGDTSMATRGEVEALAAGGSARVKR